MSGNIRLASLVAMIGAASVVVTLSADQVKYAVGDNLQPVFEGWEWNPDGSATLNFGYLNRNYEEEIDVPVGADNHFEPGPRDRSQPTHFGTRRHRFVFKVVVPKGWDPKARLTWIVTAHGKTDAANGWLQPEWEVNEGVEMMNIGPGGAPDEGNKAPEVRGQRMYSTSVMTPTPLTIYALDDGIPKPRKPRNANQAKMMRPQGMRIAWVQYRGPGRVTFDPEEHPAVYGQPITMTTKATFSEPGDYTIRAVVGDGTLETNFDVKVSVTPGKALSAKH